MRAVIQSPILFFLIFVLCSVCRSESKSVRQVPFNISFTHGIGLGESLSKGREVESILMVNMLTGRVDYLNGLVVGGILNHIRKDARGVLLAGIGNITGGDHPGIALSGITNVSKKANGLHVAGIATVHASADFGIHLAGISAITHGDFRGLQISGINSITQNCRGLQISGIFNRAAESRGLQLGAFSAIAGRTRGLQLTGGIAVSKEVTGAQVSTIGSVSKEITGLSLSGIASVTGKSKGMQVAILANVSQEAEGIQVGLVNVAGENKGFPIGLVSIDRSYKPGVITWVDDQLFVTAGLHSGSRKLYNIFFFGFRPHERGAHVMGVALGHPFTFTERLSLNLDVTAELIRVQAHTNSSEYWENFQNKIRCMVHLALTEKLSLYGGVSFNTTVSEEEEGLYFLNEKSIKHKSLNSNNNPVTLTPGFLFGIGYR